MTELVAIEQICWQQTIGLRHHVLWPHKSPEFCHVPEDEQGMHFGVFIDARLVCVASLFWDGRAIRLRKFATDSDYQGQGIGSQLLNHMLKFASENGAKSFWCDGRESALSFYSRFGLQPEGERFYKSDVAYFKLSKLL
ncbi:GNAT family N-acetyltransferase [Vibrio gallicus]|uniref:GNAT family N-acetyltransferase n=1 Tax=Vibrio gallicus TaxID=190897 RepID=UPI0021C2F361|nr:GNAT family N-acetyltransferase [Vibrio gallicus]